jgi:hypothetical protein
MNVSLHDFGDRMRFSDGVAAKTDVRLILLENIPACVEVVRAGEADDKNGTDYWAKRILPLRSLSVDLKCRSGDPMVDWRDMKLGNPRDDLALETWSVLPENGRPGKLGWTRDHTKATDYILWLFPTTGRWVLIPFHMLCSIFAVRWEEWRERFAPPKQQQSNGWKSECVYVPRRELWVELYRRFGGKGVTA